MVTYLEILDSGAVEEFFQRQKLRRSEVMLQSLVGGLVVHKPGSNHCVEKKVTDSQLPYQLATYRVPVGLELEPTCLAAMNGVFL